jgi:hypothetical protein
VNSKPSEKRLKSLSHEQKARYRRAILREEVAAIKIHVSAKPVLWKLATRGCDVALLWTLLEMYRTGDQGRVLKEGRQDAEGTRERLAAVAKKLGQVSKALSGARDSSPVGEERDLFDDLKVRVDEMTQCIKAGDRMLSRFSDARGFMRPEQFLYRAATYLRAITGRHCYQEIATVLECVDEARGAGAVSNAESIRRICERYSNGLRSYENAQAHAERLLRICEGDDLADILREEILVAIVPRAEAQGRKES